MALVITDNHSTGMQVIPRGKGSPRQCAEWPRGRSSNKLLRVVLDTRWNTWGFCNIPLLSFLLSTEKVAWTRLCNTQPSLHLLLLPLFFLWEGINEEGGGERWLTDWGWLRRCRRHTWTWAGRIFEAGKGWNGCVIASLGLQRWTIKWTSFAKQQPGKARQKFHAT